MLGVFAAAGGILGILHTSLLSARHVMVTGIHHTSRMAVLRAAGLLGSPPLIDVGSARADRRIEALPWVETARVSRRWPDSVTVSVVERVPIALVTAGPSGGARRSWTVSVVDGSGRVLEVLGQAPSDLAQLPTLMVPDSAGRPGSWLGPAAGPALEVAGSIPRVLRSEVRQVKVVAGGVALGLADGASVVFGPATMIPEKYEALASLLAVTSPQPGSSVDVTVPEDPMVVPPPTGAGASARS